MLHVFPHSHAQHPSCYAGPRLAKHGRLWVVLRNLLVSEQLGVVPLLRQEQPLQLSLVRLLAGNVLSWSQPHTAAAAEVAVLQQQAAVAQLLISDPLKPGFERFATEPQAGSVLAALASCFSALPLDAPEPSAGLLAELLLHCGTAAWRLLFYHWIEPIRRQPASQPAGLGISASNLQLAAAVAQQTFRLLAQMAAAAEGMGDAAAATVGQVCLRPAMADGLRQAVTSFSACCGTVLHLLPKHITDPASIAAACSLAECLLRMQSLLLAVPADAPFNTGSRAAAALQAHLAPAWPLRMASHGSQHLAHVLVRAWTIAARDHAAHELFLLATTALKWLWLSKEVPVADVQGAAAPLHLMAATTYLLATRAAIYATAVEEDAGTATAR